MKSPVLSKDICNLVREENNFDIIRYTLAFSILIHHVAVLSNYDIWWPISAMYRTKAFFVISGFLVSYSFFRLSDIKHFFSRRLNRLFPAYLCCIALCFILGLLTTSLSTVDFFTNQQTYKYLLSNILTLNFIEPKLPGVFDSNIQPFMNGSLWTIKVELALYLTVPLVFKLMHKFNKTIVLIAIILFSIAYSEVCLYFYESTGNHMYEMLNRQVFGQLKYFYMGTLFLIYFDKIKSKLPYLLLGSICLIYLFVGNAFERIIEPIILTSIVIGGAYVFKPLSFINKFDNISYGIFAYHYPIIQLLVYMKVYEKSFTLGISLTLLITIILSYFSYHYIEKGFLKQKPKPAVTAAPVIH